MNGLPYYKAYPRDFIEGTVGMSFELKGAYRLVLDLIYMQGGNLPDDERYISGLLGCTIRKWKSLRSELVARGKIQVNGEFLTNERAVSELETLRKLTDKQSENRSKPNKNKEIKSPPFDHTEPDTDTEATLSSVADPLPQNDLDILQSKLIEAAGENGIQPHGSIIVGPIVELIATGVNLELDILPVIRARCIGANHERPRSWIIGCDPQQVADANGFRWDEGRSGWRRGVYVSFPQDTGDADEGFEGESGEVLRGTNTFDEGIHAFDASGIGHESRRTRGRRADGDGTAPIGPGHVCEHGIRWPWACDDCDRNAPYAPEERRDTWPILPGSAERDEPEYLSGDAGDASHADQAGQADGCMVAGVRQAEIADDGCGAGRRDAGPGIGQMAVRTADCGRIAEWRADWSLDDLARHLQLDDGLSTWVAGTRIAVGGPRGTSAASLIVEAFGDAVVPQIPEAIGKAILRTERALAAIYERASV